jgi:hypothetical protein
MMSFTAETTDAFQHRLAELAWAEADELAKRTIVGNLVTRLLADQSSMTRIANKMYKSLEESLLKDLHKDARVKEATEGAVGKLCDTVLATDFTSHASHAMEKAIDSHVKTQITVGTVAKLTQHINLNDEIRAAVTKWTMDCTKKYLEQISDSLTTDARTILLALLGMVKDEVRFKIPPAKQPNQCQTPTKPINNSLSP